MKEKNYSKQIIELLSQPGSLAGLTSKVIASYINKPEDFIRVYLNRLSKKRPGKEPKIEIIGKRGKFNIYHISARTSYEFKIEILTRENKQLKKLNEQWESILSNTLIKKNELEKKLENIIATNYTTKSH